MARPSRSLLERLNEYARPDDSGCWIWTGYIRPDGYGQIWTGSKIRLAHRMSYMEHVGPVPDGLQLDHLCRNRACVNPDHLEAVTPRENTLRGLGPSGVNATLTHCVNGHPLSGDNLRLEPRPRSTGGVERRCRTCHRERERARYRRLADK